MQRVEEIKNKRQAHHIFQRMKMAKKIQKAKDIKEVERDLALIKSPAAGLRQAMKAKQHEEEEEEGGVEMSELDTSLNLAANKKKVKARQEAKVEEVHEDKLEEMMEEAN
jgi:large subunit ribosomal protein L24e